MLHLTTLAAAVAAAALAGSAPAAPKLNDPRVGHQPGELAAQIRHSTDVVAFFTVGRGAWMTHRRHRSCADVAGLPRQLCVRSRALLRAHRWLLGVARGRLERLERPADPRELGRRMAAAAGWTGREWDALDALWGTYESGWSPTAHNSSSDACGIPQAMNDCAYGYDPAAQIRWGIRYIRGRYRTPSAALGHRLAAGWY